MPSFLKAIYQNIVTFGLPMSLILYLLFGFLFIFISHPDNSILADILTYIGVRNDKFQFWRDTCKIFGQTVITSGVATSLLRTNFFSGILQKQLLKVVYSEQLLENRRDIGEIWSRVSKVLYSNKFPDIADKINDTITKRYFPINKHYYYFKANNSVTIDVLDSKSKLIEVTETFSGIIKIHRTFFSRFNPLDNDNIIRIKGSIGLLSEDDVNTNMEVKGCLFNGKELEAKKDFKKEGVVFRYDICFNLKDISDDSINYEYTTIKKLHLLEDVDFINKICDNIHYDYSLYVNYDPQKLDVWFVDLGTADRYTNPNINAKKGQISKKYEGVMFPGQGCSLVLRIK